MQGNIVVLGAGPAGISASYHLKQKGFTSTVYEKDSTWGGLCGCFDINGFRFDKFVHFSFPKNEYLKELFYDSLEIISHSPVSYNYWKGYWLKHPAQNNLSPLPIKEKVKIIEDFINKPQKDILEIKNYAEWLYMQYGKYFAENFPFAYTRKYWGKEAAQLETKWVGKRMHIAPLSEVLTGAFEEQKENFYYTKVMNYPKKGGYKSLFRKCQKEIDILYDKEVILIDLKNNELFFSDGTKEKYEQLISSLPLPEMAKIIKDCPQRIKEAAEKLNWTCGYQVSFGFNRSDIAKYLWFYIYDEDILPARVYSPSLKSSDNVPENSSSLQAEVFFSNDAKIKSKDEVFEKTKESLKKICSFSDNDISVEDIRFEKYANVIFTPDIYQLREIIRNWLSLNGIRTIGRFGMWDYLWSHQAFLTGMNLL